MRRTLTFAALAFLLAAGAAFGQAQRGTISIQVQADDGSALPGATVSAASDQTLTRRTVITGSDGSATLVGLDPATNYVVEVSLESFGTARFENVLVKAGQSTPLQAQLSLATISEEVVVTGELPLVDITSAQTGEDITLQLTEALPTARSYQDYLQLVPGVQATIDGEGNPASRSGINYRDVLGEVGRSTDNFYYFDGINVTDNVTGTFGANLNTEIIQEQSVLTGGIPAEFVGAPGLISNVVTKSGGNDFSGSVNYYFQDDSLVDDNEHFANQSFSRFDTAVTLGGPLVRDKAWFYASYRLLEREDDVISPDDNSLLRSVTNESDQGFAKLTWAITDQDLFSGLFLSDPSDISGRRDNNLSNARDFAREQGGERFSLNYNRVFSNLFVELGYSDHEGDLNDTPTILEAENTASFRNTDVFRQSDEQLGGDGDLDLDTRGNELTRLSVEWLGDSSFGDHNVKGGYEFGESFLFEDERFVDGAQYVSLSSRYTGQGIRLGQIDGTDGGGGFSTTSFVSDNQDNVNGLNNFLATHPRRGEILAAHDLDGNGILSGDELAQMQFFSTAGNPHGQINYTRDLETASGQRTMTSEVNAAYVQDLWQWNRWSINLGVRAERFEHFASTGARVHDFGWEYAPRLSVAYDLRGDGRQRLSLYYGRYYDAIRNNMTAFAGSLNGQQVEEQLWFESIGEYVTYRERGGPTTQNGFFAPNIRTPYTDELQLGYKQDLGNNMSFEANVIRRETSDIMEDFSPTLYTDAADYIAHGGDLSDPNSLFLGEDYFGFGAAGQPQANFFISTLPPEAFREWTGVELVLRKRYSDNWQALASYNYADAEGNTNSDGLADFGGDVLWLDPRAPNVEGTQPGLVEHLFKVAASYDWDNGFQVGGAYRYNSGVVANVSGQVAFDRHIPQRVSSSFEFAGINDRWIDASSVGQYENPSYGILDLRAAYLWDINGRMTADFFLDIFNVLDEQEAAREQTLVGGGSGFQFGQGVVFNDPRRYFLGARLRF